MVPLPRTVLLALRTYWREARPTGPELFPGRGAARTVSRTATSQALKQIAAQAGIDKDLRAVLKSELGCDRKRLHSERYD